MDEKTSIKPLWRVCESYGKTAIQFWPPGNREDEDYPAECSIAFIGPDREANAQLFLRAQHMGELVEALSEVGVWTIEEDAGYVRVNICNVEIARVRSDSAKAAALFKFDAKQRAILAKIGGGE